MKRFTLILTALFCACSAVMHPDKDKAKAMVEALIQKENKGDYAATTEYYTDDFNKSEPLDARTTKYQQMHEALGDFVSMECIKATDSTDANDFPSVDLIYRVKHSKLNTIEEFTVITEAGKLKVEEHSVVKE